MANRESAENNLGTAIRLVYLVLFVVFLAFLTGIISPGSGAALTGLS